MRTTTPGFAGPQFRPWETCSLVCAFDNRNHRADFDICGRTEQEEKTRDLLLSYSDRIEMTGGQISDRLVEADKAKANADRGKFLE
jgi:hypothetical protein